MDQVDSDKIIPSTLPALLSRCEGTDRSPTGFVSIWCSWRTGHWGGGRGGAIIRPISAVPPKFMSVIRAHSSKLPVNRPFSMKRLLFVILRCFDWSSSWRRNTGLWARPTARGARAEQAPWGILGDSIAVISWETTTQTPWRSFTSKDGPQPPAQH